MNNTIVIAQELNEEPKKGKVLKKLLLIFFIIALVVALYLLLLSDFTFKKDENILGYNDIDIFQKYPVNGVKVYYNDGMYIAGLKNQEVENIINAELRKYELTDKTYCNTTFNRSNLLSISCFNEIDATLDKGFNINLNDGTFISFKDLFSNYNIKGILSAIGNSFCDNREYRNNLYGRLLTKINLNLDYYLNDIEYYLTETGFVIFVDKNNLYSPEEYVEYDYGQFMTVYTKFLNTENIYNTDLQEDYMFIKLKNKDNTTDDEYYQRSNEYENNTIVNLYFYNNTDKDYGEEQEKYKLKVIKFSKVYNQLYKYIMDENKDKLTSKYNIVDINAYITNSDNYKGQIYLTLTINHYEDKKDFIDESLINTLPSNMCNTDTCEDYITLKYAIDVNNNIIILEEDPFTEFDYFKERLLMYLKSDIAEDEFDYDDLINNSHYAVDIDNGNILMETVCSFDNNKLAGKHCSIIKNISYEALGIETYQWIAN